MLDPKLAATISRLIEADASELARRANALPVYNDMGGTLLLTRDGEVLSLESESDAIGVEASPRWRKMALIAAAERYPDLAPLRPTMDANSVSCNACHGRGKLEMSGHDVRCGTCLGLGWV